MQNLNQACRGTIPALILPIIPEEDVWKIQAETFFELKLQLFRRACQRLFNLQPDGVSRCAYVRVPTQRPWKKFRTLIKGLAQSSGDYKPMFGIVPK